MAAYSDKKGKKQADISFMNNITFFPIKKIPNWGYFIFEFNMINLHEYQDYISWAY